MQSAGILVVRPLPPGSTNTVERIVDIRVDDHEDPFKELRRLLYMTTGVPNRLSESATKLAEQGKFTEAITELHKALAINPRSEPLHYALAQRYAQAGDTKNALKWLATAVTRQPKVWKPRAAEDPLFEKLRMSQDFKRLITN
jgi:predicted Zn-dependent protease